MTYGFTLRSKRKKSKRRGSLTLPILTRMGWNSSALNSVWSWGTMGHVSRLLKLYWELICSGLNFLSLHTYHDSYWQTTDLGDRSIFHCHLLFPVPSPIREAQEGTFLEFYLSPAQFNQESPHLSPPSEWRTLCPCSFSH